MGQVFQRRIARGAEGGVLMWNVIKQIKSVIGNKTKVAKVSYDTLDDYDSFTSGKWVQLSFLDMLDELEGVKSDAMMVHEDEPVGYGRYRAKMYQLDWHEKLFIARGNVFDVEGFWADGVAAFIKGGFNNISASYGEFKATPHEGIHVAEYLYNNPGTPLRYDALLKVIDYICTNGFCTIDDLCDIDMSTAAQIVRAFGSSEERADEELTSLARFIIYEIA